MVAGKAWLNAMALCVAIAAAVPPALGQVENAQPSQAVQRDIDALAATLADGRATQLQREEAAKRLVLRQTPEARAILAFALNDSSRPPGQLAVARALANDPHPDPSLIGSLQLMLGPDRTTEAAAQALANYKGNSAAFRALENYATSALAETPRVSVIKAIGGLPERPAAQTLMTLLTRENESEKIRNAAANALVKMTGLEENDHDVQKWQRWWAASTGKSDAEWRAALLDSRERRAAELQNRYDDVVREIQVILSGQYYAAPPEQQAAILVRYLVAQTQEVRVVGARLIIDLHQNGKPVPAPARERLPNLVGDSSTSVRLAAAEALKVINDASALDALLTQLTQEPDSEVRAAIAGALGSIGDVRAVPELRKLLRDPTLATATAAARALKDLGESLRKTDPNLAHDIADELRSVLESRTGGPGTDALRAACVDAMVPLHDKDLLNTFSKLLGGRESTGVRYAALKGIGELGEARAADTIARYLDDPEGSVRLAAVTALGNTSAAEYADTLFAHLYPPKEDDPSVRDEVWKTLSSIFPQMPTDRLQIWATRFKENGDSERRLLVLKDLAEKYLKQKDLEQLAITQQNIGETCMTLGKQSDAIASFSEAATYFKLALDYWNQHQARAIVMAQLVEQYLSALLRSRQYPEAARFGEQLIGEDPNNQQTVGPGIRAETERLLKDAKDSDLANARLLIAEALKMKPPLAPRYADELSRIDDDVKRQRAERDRIGRPTTTAP